MTQRAWKSYTYCWGQSGQKQTGSPTEGSDGGEGMAGTAGSWQLRLPYSSFTNACELMSSHHCIFKANWHFNLKFWAVNSVDSRVDVWAAQAGRVGAPWSARGGLVVLWLTPPERGHSDTAKDKVTPMGINSKAALKEAGLNSKQAIQHKLLISRWICKI